MSAVGGPQAQGAVDVRKVAIAKLKRAASLPRMKDGRRPAMHTDGVSEGEKSGSRTPVVEDLTKPLSATEDTKGIDCRLETAEDHMANSIDTLRQTTASPSVQNSPPEADVESEGMPVSSSNEHGQHKLTQSKRRSRSRSRSRGSKDFKKLKNPLSPSISSLQARPARSEESSQEEEPTSLPAYDHPAIIPMSPIHFLAQQANFSGYSPIPQNNPFTPPYPPVSPPSLEMLQARLASSGLSRSNSAAARLMAMQKLTGEMESARSPKPPSAFLTRNNTIAGGEAADRSMARNALFRKLSNRRNPSEGDQTSGGEDMNAPSRRRRRSRRRSAGSSTIVDDRDPPSATNIAHQPVKTPIPQLPVLPGPVPTQHPIPSPAPSHTSSHANNVKRYSLERNREGALAKLTGEDQFEYDLSQTSNQRRLVVEDNDDDNEQEQPVQNTIQVASHSGHLPNLVLPKNELEVPNSRIPRASDAPSAVSTDSAVSPSKRLPVFMADDKLPSPFRQDVFPISPFQTPLRAKDRSPTDDEEEVVYRDEARNGRGSAPDKILSWIEPEPEMRMPMIDNTGDSNQAGLHITGSSDITANEVEEAQQNGVDQMPSESQDLLMYGPSMVIAEPLNLRTSNVAFSNSTAATLTTGNEADESSSSDYALGEQVQDRNLSPTPDAPAFDLSDWEQAQNQYDGKAKVEDLTSNINSTKWDSVKKAVTGKLSRASSFAGSTGRRSRSNSVVNRNAVESAASRESASSLASGKTEPRPERNSHQNNLSASESILSLHALGPPRSGVSPIPPATPSDLMYMDAKLYPFPGLVNLKRESERKRIRGMSLSASTPDVTSIASSNEKSPGATTPATERERRLSSQASDSRLQIKYQQHSQPSSSSRSGANVLTEYSPDSAGDALYRAPQSKVGKLPMDRQGVKHWLKKFVSSQTSGSNLSSLAKGGAERWTPAKKPSFSDVLLDRSDDAINWDDHGVAPMRSERSPAPRQRQELSPTPRSMVSTLPSPPLGSEVNGTPGVREGIALSLTDSGFTSGIEISTAPMSHREGGATGDVQYWAEPSSPISEVSHGASLSFTPSISSVTSSLPSPDLTKHVVRTQSSNLVRSFDASVDSMASSRENPRKLLAACRVLQVVDGNTVKHRILFLFNDMLVLAKSRISESASGGKEEILEETVDVKLVSFLHKISFRLGRSNHADVAKLLRERAVCMFVQDFKYNPDRAVQTLQKGRHTHVALAYLLFHAQDLDKAQLGGYLARRDNRLTLKAYIDQFGFAGVRIDQALRVFWMSIRAPEGRESTDSLLSTFATRWFDVNSQLVSFGRDLAVRIVGAIMQLNSMLHPAVSYYEAFSPSVQVSARDFVDAFRQSDRRGLVSDELLEHIHGAIQQEKLVPALDSSISANPIEIEIPSELKLTYRTTSSPILVRIPRPDSNFSVQLLGHGLLFDPPELNFARSNEASFRVSGTNLGPKFIIFSKIGPHASYYSGLPLSSTVVVERAFMQNVFELSLPFAEKHRKYLFSLAEDQLHIAAALERQISETIELHSHKRKTSSQLQKAAEIISQKVLVESLCCNSSSGAKGHLLNRSLQEQPSVPRSGGEVVTLCCQNSLLAPALIQAALT